MATAYISEYADVMYGPGVIAIGAEPALAEQVVTYTGTAGLSAALNNNTRLVRVHVDGIASIKFGTAPVAVANTNKRMIAGQTEYFSVPSNKAYKISFVTST